MCDHKRRAIRKRNVTGAASRWQQGFLSRATWDLWSLQQVLDPGGILTRCQNNLTWNKRAAASHSLSMWALSTEPPCCLLLLCIRGSFQDGSPGPHLYLKFDNQNQNRFLKWRPEPSAWDSGLKWSDYLVTARSLTNNLRKFGRRIKLLSVQCYLVTLLTFTACFLTKNLEHTGSSHMLTQHGSISSVTND